MKRPTSLPTWSLGWEVLRSPTIKGKLGFLLLFSVAALVAVGVSGWVGANRVGRALGKISGQTLPAVQSLTGMRMAQLNAVLLTREVLAYKLVLDQFQQTSDLAGGIKDAQDFLGTVLRREAVVRGDAQKFYASYAALPKTREEKGMWQTLEPQWSAFFEGEAQIVATIEAARKTQDWDVLTGQFRALSDQDASAQGVVVTTEKMLGALIDLNKEYARGAQTAGDRARAGAERLIAGIFVVALGGLLLIAATILRSVVGALESMKAAIVSVAETNDFTTRLQTKGRDEASQTGVAFNDLLARMQTSLREVLDNASRIADAARQSAETSSKVSESSTSQSEAAVTIAAAIEEMTASIHHIADSTREALEQARRSGSAADEGSTIISQAAGEMDAIAEQVGAAGTTIRDVGSQAERISVIVELINDIADQTSLLALNAAIEAARAGEQGRGFAVVADEVRKLADRTTKATHDITEMVGGMQRSARLAVEGMGAVTARVEAGKELSSQAAQRMTAIRVSATEVTEAVSGISVAIEQQSATTQDIAQRVDSVSRMSEENCAAASQTAVVSRELTDMAQSLRAVALRFKV